MKSPKILAFDIECSHLKADFGTILCIGYKWLGQKKVYVPSVLEYDSWKKCKINDSDLIRDFAKIMEEADVWLTYNGKRFDVPYLYAKMIEYGIQIPPNTPHLDIYWTVKSNMALSRKSLANVSWFMKLDAEKTPVDGRDWKLAATGDEKAIKYVVDHCKADVDLLEEAYLKLRPLIRGHVRVAGYGPCRACGSKDIERRGYAMTSTKGRRIRIKCKDCGSWESRPDTDCDMIPENENTV